MWNEIKVQDFISQYLPPDAKLLWLEEPNRRPAVISADLDGDGTHEIAAAYRLQNENEVMILKWFNGYWHPISNIKGRGYGITYLHAAPVTGTGINDLIIGWQHGAIYSELDIQEWSAEGFQPLLEEGIFFSEIEVENLPAKHGKDAKHEIALWQHDTGEAYKVEVYQWDGKRLAPYPQAYPAYFRKVVQYYQKQVMKLPDAAFYWFYLADAQAKARQYNEALKSVDIALNLNAAYPSRDRLLELRKHIVLKLRNNSFLYPASVQTIDGIKWGYINNEGDFVLRPQYENAMDFQHNGLAIVDKGSYTGVIDLRGRYILPPKFSHIAQFNEGRAAVADDAGFRVADENGRILTRDAYSYIGTYQNARAVYNSISQEGTYLYGYLDRAGRELIPMRYLSANDFINEAAVVQESKDQFFLIDTEGHKLHSYHFAFVGNPGNGLLPFQPDIGSKYGYIDMEGDIVIQPKYSLVLPFSGGRAIVGISDGSNDYFGLIDKEGNYIIQPIYNDILSIGEDRAALGKALIPAQPYAGSRYAIADMTSGSILTDFAFTNVSTYQGGYVSVSNEVNTFFLNRDGKLAEELPVLKGNGTLAFVGDLIRATIDLRFFYMDGTRVIWKQNDIIELNKQYKVAEMKYKPDKDYLVYYPQLLGITELNIQKNINEQLKSLSKVKPPEDQPPLDYSYTGDFSIAFFMKHLLVLELNAYQYYFGAAHGMPTKTHPHINLATGQFYELKDLFKPDSDYTDVLSSIIGEQIKNDPKYTYVFLDEYKGISENQPFFVSEDAIYIYFAPYEIAPYAAGFPTFRIPYDEIMPIINKEGSFWRAFH